jgi:hypothetical protein|tara:strand:- start:964 stop:1473 length:510 start_codon:yes stop_codon:yes gene_type:complete
MKIIDNFLLENYFKELQTLVYSDNFPWFYQQKITTFDKDNNFMFTHILYNNDKSNSDFFPKFELIKYFIKQHSNFSKFLRIKLNLYTNQGKKIKHSKHHDWTDTNNKPDKDVKICILNFTTCNGVTVIKKQPVQSKENQMIFFNNTNEHYGVTQDNKDTRIVLNIVYKN